MAEIRFPVERLQNFIQAAFAVQGVPGEHARIAAQRMIESDLRGMGAHGILRLPPYSRRIREGGYNLSPKIKVTRETPVSALVDGDNGLGQVVMTFVADLAIQKAKESGMAWVGTHHDNHAGCGGVYASLPLRHDMIAMYSTVANANHMAPWNGVDRLLSTNPLAIAIPAGEEPAVVLDIATTVVSYGRIKLAAQRGETMPVGWMIDPKGEPLTDPNRSDEGFLLPIGGYKGYGLNFILGALAGVMNGAAFGSAVIDFNKDFKSVTNTGHLFFVMRPDLFRGLKAFKEEMDVRIREIRNSTPMEGKGPILLPGELEHRSMIEVREKGVPINETLLKQLRELAASLKLADRLEG